MSIMNLSSEAFDAVIGLKNNRDWQLFKHALNEQMVKSMHVAVDAAPDSRSAACGYARCLRDLMAAIETYELGPGARIQRPNVPATTGSGKK